MNTVEDVRVPRYLRLADELRQEIRRGTLKPGDRLPSFTQVKAKHGLSQDTWQKVHAVLVGENLIVREVGRGTFVSGPVPFAPAVRHGVLGVAGHGFAFNSVSPYWARLFGGMCEAARAADMQLLILQHDSKRGWNKADGVVLFDWKVAAELMQEHPAQPCLSIIDPIAGMPSVVADDYGGARVATEHLLQLGHRRIGFIQSGNHTVMPARRAGYHDALEAAGVAPHPRWIRQFSGTNDYGEHFVTAGRECMRSWFADDWKSLGCTAILAQNDDVAAGAIAALKQAGYSIPRDVSVIGFDGLSSDISSQRLTTVKVPLHQIGSRAIEVLLELIDRAATNGEKNAAIQHHVVPTQLQVGRSTAVARL